MKNMFMKGAGLFTATCGVILAVQSGSFLVSTRETSKELSVIVDEDSGLLQVLVPAGNTDGDAEGIRGEDITANAFDAAGKEVGMPSDDKGPLVVTCIKGCTAVKTYRFSAPKANTDQVRKVIVALRKKQYELMMEKYSPSTPRKR